MENKENENNYVIPANYTDSGKLFGGMVAPRNAAEAVVTLLTVGYLEYLTIPAGTVRIIAMAVTLLPLGILALMGIDGDSLLQYFWQVVRYVRRRRKLHFQKIGGEQNEKEKG